MTEQDFLNFMTEIGRQLFHPQENKTNTQAGESKGCYVKVPEPEFEGILPGDLRSLENNILEAIEKTRSMQEKLQLIGYFEQNPERGKYLTGLWEDIQKTKESRKGFSVHVNLCVMLAQYQRELISGFSEHLNFLF